MWWMYAVSSVLLLRAPVEGAVCDDGQLNIQRDLPEKSVYMCDGRSLPLQKLQLPSIASRYTQENSFHACMDTEIEYTAPIPNSGGHRPVWAKYGEYIYCPPQRWVHNLQHGGVAFLYHPCIHPHLKQAFALLARSCVSRHIITPLPSLSRERPLALAAWCSTLQMSHINVTEIRDWLRKHIPQNVTDGDGTYQHLLIRASTMTSANTEICSDRRLQVLNYFPKKGSRLKRHILRKRRSSSLPGAHNVALSNVSTSTISTAAPSVPSIEAVSKNPGIVSHEVVTGEHVPPKPTTSAEPEPPKPTTGAEPVPPKPTTGAEPVPPKPTATGHPAPSKPIVTNPTVAGRPAPPHPAMTGEPIMQNLAVTSEVSPPKPVVTGEISLSQSLITAHPAYFPEDTDIRDSKGGIHSRELDKTLMPELPVDTAIPSAGNKTHDSIDTSVSHFIKNNSSEEMEQKEQSEAAVTQVKTLESQQNHQTSMVTSHAPILETPGDQNDVSSAAAQSPALSNQQKPECRCQQDSTPESPAKLMRRLSAGRQKNFLSTPRTEEATWAAASLIFLLALLTFAVLYTQLYKKFRKSQSLYWASESHSEDTETVASIIKRRLVQGHSKRKKWIGRKKSTMRLYESLSDSSD